MDRYVDVIAMHAGLMWPSVAEQFEHKTMQEDGMLLLEHEWLYHVWNSSRISLSPPVSLV